MVQQYNSFITQLMVVPSIILDYVRVMVMVRRPAARCRIIVLPCPDDCNKVMKVYEGLI